MAKSTKRSRRGSEKSSKTRAKKAARKKRASRTKQPVRKGGAAKPRATPPRKRRLPKAAKTPPPAPVGLSEEDAIRSAKYLPRELPRLFEEERFIFPESYGVNRVRLLVKDPEWLFAHWDVSPATIEALKREIGERALALSRLTLRISDPVNGGSSDILLAPGARSWYVRTDEAPRSYKAELGMTLPSGVFHRIAESNVVGAPRVGPSTERARRHMSYPQAKQIGAEVAQAALGAPGSRAAGPWKAPSVDAAQPAPSVPRRTKGGASDVFAPGGASDVFRR